ncbi:hypothetical protein FUAX_49360 (plasmid) [Fulvitalea axinellae]|uniref:Choice-of-anchor I domain-containing protein n=1 Tax=Fulvitalea axinellae TaxID=1182444 RepID=A0AAU9D1G9_9BACT|nr:hypothetical protein FUAX_49360 [Fulvitalea axinellae]
MLKNTLRIAGLALVLATAACSDNDSDNETDPVIIPEGELFKEVAKLSLGTGVPEISAYDEKTKNLFVVNTEKKAVDVVDLTDPASPILGSPISVTTFGGNLNSVDVRGGKLAVAVEAEDKSGQKGKVVIFDTDNLTTPFGIFEAGYLPDMVKFTPDGRFVLAANEGEPNDDYTVDPEGSVTLIDVANKTASTIGFEGFNSRESELESNHFRVFGQVSGQPSTLAQDVEPEYIAVSSDSKYAWVCLQENNGFAKIDIATKTITDIFPLGVKDYNIEKNAFDLSDKDDKTALATWPVKSYYQPDAIDYFEINGTGYIKYPSKNNSSLASYAHVNY